MASVAAIRAALAARLETISPLHVYATVPGSPTVPAAVVGPESGTFLTYDVAFSRGADDLAFVVLVLASRADDRSGQITLDDYLAGEGPLSIKAAIEADPTLGGTAQDVSVTEARNYGDTEFGGVNYFGCELVVEVAA